MRDPVLEVCVDNPAGLAEALAGGADRIELCAALELGGLTPSRGFMVLAASCGVPVVALIRARPGDFVFSPAEIDVMLDDIRAARAAGLAGVAIGALTPDAGLDRQALEQMAGAAAGMGSGMGLTLHRAFDVVADRAAALEMAIGLGFRRILTSGGAATALAGAAEIAGLMERAAGRITIMPGGGVTPENVPDLKRLLPMTEVHGSFGRAVAPDPSLAALGLAPSPRQTDATRVAAARRALRG